VKGACIQCATRRESTKQETKSDVGNRRSVSQLDASCHMATRLEYTLFSRRVFLTTKCKRGVIHKTGRMGHIATLPEDDRVTTLRSKRRKFGKVSTCVIREICARTDRQADKKTLSLQYSAPLPAAE